MSADPTPKPARSWREVARELARETNRDRVVELSHELNRALDEQMRDNVKFRSVT
jgi:hypothetical protein